MTNAPKAPIHRRREQNRDREGAEALPVTVALLARDLATTWSSQQRPVIRQRRPRRLAERLTAAIFCSELRMRVGEIGRRPAWPGAPPDREGR